MIVPISIFIYNALHTRSPPDPESGALFIYQTLQPNKKLGKPMDKSDHFFFCVARLHRLATKTFGRELRSINMTHGLAAVLLHLDLLDEGCSQRELAFSLEIEQPTLANLIKRLEQLQVIEKKPHSNDHRKSMIYFTTKGRELFVQISRIYEATYRDMLAGLDKHELRLAEALLGDVYQVMKTSTLKHPESPPNTGAQ